MSSGSNISVGTKAWSDRINALWRKSISDVISIGHELLKAKETTPHGDFERMIKEELDFSPQTARKLMAVASDPRLANRAQGALPDHWTTLYELTKLDDEALERAFAVGVIGPDMQRSEATKLRNPRAKPITVTEAEYHELEQNPEWGAVGDLAPKSSEPEIGNDEAESSSETNPQPSDAGGSAPGRLREPDSTDQAGTSHSGAGGSPATNGAGKPAPPNDPVIACATGIELLLLGIGEAEPAEVAESYPADMPLFSDDLSNLVHWLSDLELAFRAIHGAGNAAAMEADAR